MLLLALIVPLLSSCSDGNDDAAASEPCQLMSAEEIKRYVNVPPEDQAVALERPGNTKSPASIPGMRLCRFIHKSRPIAVDIGVSSSFPREEFERWRKAGIRDSEGEVVRLKRVKGIGREAWRYNDAIFVPIEGNKVLGVSVQMSGDESNHLERARRLMRILLKRAEGRDDR